jgi:hypothetical protein
MLVQLGSNALIKDSGADAQPEKIEINKMTVNNDL